MVLILGTAGGASAWEAGAGAYSRAMVSNNIDRAPIGKEVEGYRLSMGGNAKVMGYVGAGTVNLNIMGGWETENGETADFDTYSVLLDARLPWSRTGYFEGSASIADETVDPDLTDISQVRVRTRTSELSLGIGKKATPTVGWFAGVTGRTEKRFDRDLKEGELNLGWETVLNTRRSLDLDVGLRSGTDDFMGNTWTGYTMTVDTSKQLTRSSSSGYRVEWEGSQLELRSGVIQSSDRVTVLHHYEKLIKSNWSLANDIGTDGIHPQNAKREWLPRWLLGIRGDTGERTRVYATAYSSSTIQDPEEAIVSRTTNSVFDAGLTWNLFRNLSFGPRFVFRDALLVEEGAPDRTDQTYLTELGLKWIPGRDWSIDLTFADEDLDSTNDSFDLSETRLELALAGLF